VGVSGVCRAEVSGYCRSREPQLHFLFGLIIEIGLLTGDATAIVSIIGFIPLGKLFYAWCFPIQY
jgi:hypothetical protein